MEEEEEERQKQLVEEQKQEEERQRQLEEQRKQKLGKKYTGPAYELQPAVKSPGSLERDGVPKTVITS